MITIKNFLVQTMGFVHNVVHFLHNQHWGYRWGDCAERLLYV